MKLTKGFNDHKINGTWRDAKNIVCRDSENPWTEPGFTNTSIGAKIIGNIPTDRGVILFTYNHPYLIVKEIKFDSTETTILNTRYLSIDSNQKIEGTFKYNYKNELIIIWWNGAETTSTKPCIFNVDNPYVSINSFTKELETSDHINKLYLLPEATTPNISLVKVVDGGNLKTGTYFVAVSFSLRDGSETDILNISNPIIVTSNSKVTVTREYDGCDSNKDSYKSFDIVFDGLDTRFDYVNVYIIYRKDGVLSYYYYNRYNIGIDGININDLSNKEEVSSDILIPTNYIEKFHTGVQLRDKLYIATAYESEDLGYQKYANNITIKAVRMDSTNEGKGISLNSIIDSYKNSTTIFFNKGFKTDEVYAFYIYLNLKNGKKSKLYHIPGRASRFIYGTLYSETELIRNLSSSIIGDSDKLLDINNDLRFFEVNDNLIPKNPDGTYDMAYWENKDEQYPYTDDFLVWKSNSPSGKVGDLRNKNVRHHKFPSALRILLDGEKLLKYESNPVLNTVTQTIKFSPRESWRRTDGAAWNVGEGMYYSKHYFNNVDFGTIKYMGYFDAYYYQANRTQDIVISGNYKVENENTVNEYFTYRIAKLKINEFQPDQYETLIYSAEEIQVDAYDEFSDTISTTSIHLEAGEKIVLAGYLTNEFIDFTTGDIEFEVTANLEDTSVFAYPMGIQVSGVYFPDEIKDQIVSWGIAYAVRNINNCTRLGQSLLIPSNMDYGSPDGNVSSNIRFHAFDNLLLTPSIKPSYIKNICKIKFKEDSTPIGSTTNVKYYDSLADSDINTNYGLLTGICGFREIFNTKYLKNNLSMPVDNTSKETCISMEIEDAITGLNSLEYILSDLCFLNRNLYFKWYEQEIARTGKEIDKNTTTATIFGGDTYISEYGMRIQDGTDIAYFRFACESICNIGLRQYGEEEGEKYFPKSWAATYKGSTAADDMGICDHVEYNLDFNVLNTLLPLSHFVPEIENVNYFPFRIYKTLAQGNEAVNENWRKFLANEYWEGIKTKGKINKLVTDSNNLYIQYENTLYVAKTKDELLTDNGIAVNLGQADILSSENPPVEIVHQDFGYIGNIDKDAILWTKYGYFVFDRESKKIFQYRGESPIEISSPIQFTLNRILKSSSYTRNKRIRYNIGNIDYDGTGAWLYENKILFTGDVDNIIFGFNNELDTLFITILKEEFEEIFVIDDNTIAGTITLQYNLGCLDGETFKIIHPNTGLEVTFVFKTSPDPGNPLEILIDETLNNTYNMSNTAFNLITGLYNQGILNDQYPEVISYNIFMLYLALIPGQVYEPTINSENNRFTLLNSTGYFKYYDYSETLSYYCKGNIWYSRHDWIAHGMISHKNVFYSLYNDYPNFKYYLRKHNFLKDAGKFSSGNNSASYIDVIFDENDYSKVIDSINWMTEAYNKTSELYVGNKTITHITVYTLDKISGELRSIGTPPVSTYLSNVALTITTESVDGNVKKDVNKYRFNKIWDLLRDKTIPIIDTDGEILDLSTLNPATQINNDDTLANNIYNDYFYVRFYIDNLQNSGDLICLRDVDIKTKVDGRIQE